MLKLLLPLLLAALGTGAGIGAGLMLSGGGGSPDAPASPAEGALIATAPCGDPEDEIEAEAHDPLDPSIDYVKLSNQFVIPVVRGEAVSALVVLSLSVEVPNEYRDTVFSREPKLRDIFLQVLFDHANMGGFDGAFTDSNQLDVLRQSLLEAARKQMRGYVTDVLITDIARQDV